MERLLVDVEHRHRLAEAGPDAVIVDAGRHDEDEHFVGRDLGSRYDFELHRGLGTALTLAPDRPGMHGPGHVKIGRNLADRVEVLHFTLRCTVCHVESLPPRFGACTPARLCVRAGHGRLSSGRHIVQDPYGLQAILLHCNTSPRDRAARLARKLASGGGLCPGRQVGQR